MRAFWIGLSALVFLAIATTNLTFGQQAAKSTAKPRLDEAPKLKPYQLRVGETGRFGPYQVGPDFMVVRILSDTEMVVGRPSIPDGIPRVSSGRLLIDRGSHFVLRGLPTKNLIDDQELSLNELYTVTSTMQTGGRTLAVVELAEKDTEKIAARKLADIKQDLRDLVKRYPATQAAAQARKLLEGL